MREYKITVTEIYQRDVEDIKFYISSKLDAPYTAKELISEIEMTISSLSALPYSYPLVKEIFLEYRGIRKYLVKNYIIFYKVEERKKEIVIIRIFHAKQNWLDLI